MIKLDIAKYCHDCPEFEPVVTDDMDYSFYASDERRIKCGHSERCSEMYNYIKEKTCEKRSK